MTLEEEQFYTDVLVVGSGAAGTMAAIKAASNGASVLIATKGPYPSGNSSIALSGYGVPLGNVDPRDNPQEYFKDIIQAGQGLCNEKVVKAWTTKIVEVTREMEEWGVDLIKENGKLSQISFEGHSYPRMVHHFRSSGNAVMKCLGAKSKEMGLKILEHTLIGGLFCDGEAITGAWGFQYQTGRLLFISAKTVIWATGGLGNLYPFTDNVKMITGEGYAIAFKAGAEVTGMEFCHFMPTFCYPEEMKASTVVIQFTKQLTKNGGARYYNNLGQRFMRRYFPGEGDLKSDNEDIVRAISREIYEGRGSPHGGVYLDVSDVPEEVWKRDCAPLWEKATRAKIDFRVQPLEVVPYPHDMVGGIKIDENGGTAVPGLFAAGEVAGGAHGAARIGGSALSEALAFGAICGENAVKYTALIKGRPQVGSSQKVGVAEHIQNWLDKKSDLTPEEIRVRVQQIAHKYLNVAKDEAGLQIALKELRAIENQMLPRMAVNSEDEKKRNFQISEAIEIEGQIETAKIIANAELVRAESRGGYYGGHYRIDHPERDDKNWLRNIVLKRNQDGSISSYIEEPIKL